MSEPKKCPLKTALLAPICVQYIMECRGKAEDDDRDDTFYREVFSMEDCHEDCAWLDEYGHCVVWSLT